jgi:hypothetical protein
LDWIHLAEKTSGGLLKARWWNFSFYKLKLIYWLAV